MSKMVGPTIRVRSSFLERQTTADWLKVITTLYAVFCGHVMFSAYEGRISPWWNVLTVGLLLGLARLIRISQIRRRQHTAELRAIAERYAATLQQ